MWRFLLAGVGTVGGLVVLFVGSYGDPATLWRDLTTASPVEHTPAKPDVTQSVPEVPAGRADNGGSQQQRDALRQLQDLKASLAQATQDSAALREQAEQARREIEDLRQQRATDEAALEQARLEAQREAEARRQRAAEAAKQDVAGLATTQSTQRVESPPPDLKPAPDAKPPPDLKPSADVKLPAGVKPPLDVKPSVDVKPPVDVKVVPPARPVVAAPPAPKPAPPAVRPQPAEPDARETVLTRLRREVPSRGGTVQSPSQASSDAPRQVAPDPPRPASPRQRLMDARTALAAGRTDEAQHLLEQAQVQLVLRPVTPSQDAPVGGSVAAGQVAEALSMLGAGDLLHAIRYINLAVAQADQAATPAPVVGVPRLQRPGDDYYYGR